MSGEVTKILEWATGQLTTETARLDAEVLLAHTMGIERVDLYLQKDKILTDAEHKKFINFLERRKKKEPIAYIVGHKEFWSLKLKVTPDVLIPRPETEGIVEEALKQTRVSLKSAESLAFNILDLCTGSGCVAAALATELPDAKITVTDISPEAIEVAKQNLEFASDCVKFYIGKLFEALPPERGEGFDLITANPPYISESDFETLPDDIRLYEPKGALASGSDGLAVSKHIIKDAPQFLKPSGILIIEIGIGQADTLKEFARKTSRYEKIEVAKDYSGINRILITKKYG